MKFISNYSWMLPKHYPAMTDVQSARKSWRERTLVFMRHSMYTSRKTPTSTGQEPPGPIGVQERDKRPMRILLVEDDEKIASFIIGGLRQSGFAVDHAAEGLDGLHLATSEPYAVAVIDVMLPGMDGLKLIEELRRRKINTPIIILSAKRSVEDRVRGLETGSDDYLSKPFSFSELLARVQALIRRSTSTSEPTRLTVGELSMNLLTREVSRGETPVALQPREFALLEYFMRNPGKVLSKTMIMEHVWDYHFDPQTNLVDVLVCRLRNKIDRDYERKMLHTLRGVGYVLKE
jgi:two-component system, OmpR family, response regulator